MNTQLKAACAAVALVGVWETADAQTTTPTTFSLNNVNALTNTVGFYHFNSSVYRDDDSTRTLIDVQSGSLAAAPSPAAPHVFSVTEERGMPLNTRYQYTFLGIYDEANDGVSILLKSSVAQNAIANGLDWNQVFNPARSAYISESQMARNLRGDYVPEGNEYSFLYGYLDLLPAWNESATLVNFSAATFGGTGFASAPGAVPEPATMAALGVGALALLRRRRNRA